MWWADTQLRLETIATASDPSSHLAQDHAKRHSSQGQVGTGGLCATSHQQR